MGMDAGTIPGEGNAVPWDKPVPERREDGGKPEDLLEPFFIMEREYIMGQGVSGHGIRNTVMLIGKFFPFAGFYGRLAVPVFWEKILPAGHPGGSGLSPETVHEIKIRTRRGQGIRGAFNGNTAQK